MTSVLRILLQILPQEEFNSYNFYKKKRILNLYINLLHEQLRI
jgi:hypothetical protein